MRTWGAKKGEEILQQLMDIQILAEQILKENKEGNLDLEKRFVLLRGLQDGNRFFLQKDYQRALEFYNQVITIEPNLAVNHLNRALVYESLKRYQEALVNYGKALELNLNLAMVYNNRGNVYYKLKKYDQALADYTNAIQLNSVFATAYLSRGLAYAALEEKHKAREDFATAIRLIPALVNDIPKEYR